MRHQDTFDLESLLPYDPKVDYFREFYRSYLENENLLTDIDLTSGENYKMERRILNVIDFYDCTLLPSIATQPHKFIHRKQMQKFQQKMQRNAELNQVRKLSAQNSGCPVTPSEDIDLLDDQEGPTQKKMAVEDQLAIAQMSSACKRKKHNRRAALEIDKSYNCPYFACDKQFGSDGSLNLHIKIKHNGGTKTERERMATLLIEAYSQSIKDGVEPDFNFEQEVIDQIQLNLPPGILT